MKNKNKSPYIRMEGKPSKLDAIKLFWWKYWRDIVMISIMVAYGVLVAVLITLAVKPRVQVNFEPPTPIVEVPHTSEELKEEIITVKNEARPEVTEIVSEPEPITYFDVPLSKDLQNHIFSECEKRDVDPSIIMAMIKRESDFDPSNISDGGNSLGLMQVQPRWHKARMNSLGCSDLMDPYQNVTVGIDLFADLYNQKGSLEWALMAYNGGPSYANKKVKNGVVTDYARAVIKNSKRLEEGRIVI